MYTSQVSLDPDYQLVRKFQYYASVARESYLQTAVNIEHEVMEMDSLLPPIARPVMMYKVMKPN